MANVKPKIATPDQWLTLRHAAQRLGLSKRTIWRACLRKRVRAKINLQTWRYSVPWSDVQRAPLLTLGKAAKLCGLRYETLRRWAKRGRLRCWRFRRLGGAVGYRRTSLVELKRAWRYYRCRVRRLRL